MKIRLLELCAGYGSQALALKNLGIEVYSEIAEFDKYASQAYMKLHGETKNYGDIYTIDKTKLPYFDIITYSTPCQDFSVAGKQAGGDKGSGTRSSLLWECERIIRAVKPKYLLMENVKNLVGEKHKHNFIKWLNVLEGLGYQNFWRVLNAKDYGIPQNRERVFCVSILGGGQYLFPNPIPLEKRLKDILEPNVDEKYYLSDKMVENLFKEREGLNYKTAINKDIALTLTTKAGQRNSDNYIQEPLICASRGRNPENPNDRTTGNPTEQRIEINNTGCSNTLTSVQKDNYVIEPLAYDEQNGYVRQDGCVGTLTTDGSSPKHNNRVIEPKVLQVVNIIETDSFGGNPQSGRIYSVNGCSPCLSTMQGGGLERKILTLGNYMPSGHSASKIVDSEGITPTVMENHGTVTATVQNYRIRKLTPRECRRLMGVKDEQFDKLSGLSNTQLYKLAGNSIVVDVIMAIFKNMFLSDEGTKGQLTLF